MFESIIYELTTTRYNRAKDRLEVYDLFEKYGDEVDSVIAQRAADRRLPVRDRRHWRRMTKAVRYFGTNDMNSDEGGSA